MLYITWLNVVGVIPFITVAKIKIYCMGVKSMASGLTLYTKAILFTPCQYILLFATVIKCIAYTIFNFSMVSKVCKLTRII